MTAETQFGSNLVAMITPMNADGSLDGDSLGALVDHLIACGCDGIVAGGTAGESPTLTEAESEWLVKTVVARAAGRTKVTAGVGTNDTASSIRRAITARRAGADGLLLVTPYYSRPTQAGIVAHCTAVADATDLPVMLYDVPARAGLAMEPSTLIELSGHPRIAALKDAKGDLFEAMSVMSRCSLAYYCGIDELNLPYLAAGATGLVSVVGNSAAERNGQLISAVRRGDLDAAQVINTGLLPFTEVVMRTSQGAIMAKAALAAEGIISAAAVRLPLLPASAEDRRRLKDTKR